MQDIVGWLVFALVCTIAAVITRKEMRKHDTGVTNGVLVFVCVSFVIYLGIAALIGLLLVLGFFGTQIKEWLMWVLDSVSPYHMFTRML